MVVRTRFINEGVRANKVGIRNAILMAGGMGSRYGGLKQIDGIGPNEEPIIEYSIYDAISSGFGKIVFVIRREFEEAFRARFDKFADKIDFGNVFGGGMRNRYPIKFFYMIYLYVLFFIKKI